LPPYLLCLLFQTVSCCLWLTETRVRRVSTHHVVCPRDMLRIEAYVLSVHLQLVSLFPSFVVFLQRSGRQIPAHRQSIQTVRSVGACTQGRIIHCAGCTMGGRGPPPSGAPDPLIKCQFFLPRCVLRTVTTKKIVNFLGEEKCAPRENPAGYAYEKGSPPYVGMGPPNG